MVHVLAGIHLQLTYRYLSSYIAIATVVACSIITIIVVVVVAIIIIIISVTITIIVVVVASAQTVAAVDWHKWNHVTFTAILDAWID